MNVDAVADLTPRQRELLERYIVLGRYRLVADEMFLSWRTVRNMATEIRTKLEVRSIGQACVMYERWTHGWN